MADDNFEDEGGEEGVVEKFVEVDGKKFVDDGSGSAKMGEDGQPVPFVENKRPPETPEARKIRLEKQTEQHKKKHPELYEQEGKKDKKDKKSDELDYGQKAYLVAKGIEDADEIDLVKGAMASSGKTLEEVLNASWFKAELKDLKDQKTVADATPGNGKRTGASAANTVEYWIAKGELPPNTAENSKLRQEVVNARMKKEKGASQFTDNPVVGK